MHYIALLPAFVALYLLRRIGLVKTFLYFFIPLIVLVPDYCKALISGLPDLSFIQGAMFPIALMTIWVQRQHWKPRLMDVVVMALASIAVISEYRAAGYADAQNYIVDMLCYVFFPYMLGRLLVEQNGLRLEVARRLVFFAAIVVIEMLYEWRFAVNLYEKYLPIFFGGQGSGWHITFRYGMARAAGPYAHAILAGIMFAVYYRLALWVMWQGGWPEKFPWYKKHPLKFGQIMWLAMAAGVFCNLAKGPWLGGFVAAFIVAISRVKFRKLYIMFLAAVLLVVVVPSYFSFLNYASVGRANAKDATQETAAYRKELIDHYWQLAVDHADFGWGKNKVPKIPGSESVDNYFLLLSLMHGLYASGLLVFIFFFTMTRLWRRASRELDEHPGSDAFGWTLLGIMIAYLISLATVFMAYQVMLMFFFILGWAETYLERGYVPATWTTSAAPAKGKPSRFRRVLA